ncbi:MotA/TolQ/ExbB proton channel family protein [Porphyromonas circumdentaria]|uniref:Biopolymer transport protein ExbB n=1 Tax=Porphyromonas circumdentaria TaxID=29524 RepID=A0A1T4M0Y4_9PORP|nr:MotA/TolQ/ExbB proton channel family protein [Porphyromonas circumdentaria]MBB6275617.1 biopolymer transport protein ExbB [Porphyromonas circumdentaria]MDO4722731.1 MotA/TolQ/ExbB proton channel family protein [Porphyromonas circumdentaria]SJZ60547.1 biopolymer transport protein ExbB [Porphyromonas circumdentaria]
MKRFFATLACTALLSVSISSTMWAQDQPATGTTEAATEQVEATEQTALEMETTEEDATEIVAPAEDAGFHQALKTKFIEGGADFMAVIVLALILGLALCLERIIYLNLADTNSEKLLKQIEASLAKGNVEEAKNIARNTRGPIASIAYQGLMRMDEGLDVVERSITAYGGVQGGLLEKNLSWITLFIAMAPSLGFLGTVVGMVMAFDKIEKVGDISPTVVAGGMKVALITTIAGLIVALILQLFYNYILSKVEAILNRMEDASISLLDLVIKHNLKNAK